MGNHRSFRSWLLQDSSAAVEQHHNVHLKIDPDFHQSEEVCLQLADGVIDVGSPTTSRTVAGGKRVLMINDMAPQDDIPDWCPKDFTTCRSQFLFYSDGGDLEPGLDLLLEALLWPGTASVDRLGS